MRKLARTVPVLILALLPAHAHAWGADVHRLVNRAATTCLPAEFEGFARWADSLEMLSTAADARRCCDPGEAIKHYIDIDDYDEFFAGTLPHGYEAMVARYGRERVDGNGILPWAIDAARQALTQQFLAHDWPRAVATAADIGHYATDGHQPLHLTRNYDGQLTDQRGIHARYESALTEIHLAELTPAPGHASAFAQPLDAVFEWIGTVYPGVMVILDADLDAASAAGGNRSSPIYYDALWAATGSLTRGWVRESALAVASLWLTAWRDAGSPPLPGDAPVSVPPAALRLRPSEPNPFATVTTLRFEVPVPGPATLRIFDARGRLVRTLLEGDPGRGERSLSWNGRDANGREVASGVYRVRLEQRGRATERSTIRVR